MSNRWWVYQSERFPLFAHGPMVLVFCLSIMLFSSLQAAEVPGIARIAGALLTTIILFFQLRVADEFKDFSDDAKFRPHRAVPRGLVTLSELARIAWIGAAIQFVIAISIDIGLVPLLFLVWLYMGLMTREFFVSAWLKRTPSVYLVSHMLIMPLIAFYVSAFDWLCACREMPVGIGWLLLFSFACGLVLEVGRKIKSPDAERAGVETYSSVWGTRSALLVWIAAGAMSVVSYIQASNYLGITSAPVIFAVGVVALMLIAAVARSSRPSMKYVEPGSAVIAMLLYLGLGPMQALLA